MIPVSSYYSLLVLILSCQLDGVSDLTGAQELALGEGKAHLSLQAIPHHIVTSSFIVPSGKEKI